MRVQGAAFFNRSDAYRFNAPDGEFGVLYVSEAVEGAFTESFGRLGRRPLSVQERILAERTVSELKWGRPLKAR